MTALVCRLIIALSFFATAACADHHSTTVQSLSEATQKNVDQNLKNGRLPSPSEVNGQVPQAQDECAAFRAKLPADWFQNKLSVPENPADPAGRQIQIFYYGKITPGSQPVLFFEGGPGDDSHSSYSLLRDHQRVYDPKNTLSFIYMDQRGTGCSDFYPQGSTPDVLERLSFYGSRGIVSDAEHLRAALIGPQSWMIFGQSYGAFIAHRYATIAPTSLKSVFAHANVISPNGDERVRARIAAQVRVMDIYLKQFPDDRRLLQNLKTQLVATKCYASAVNPQSKACGFQVIETIADELLGFTNQWTAVHEWINLMETSRGLSDDGVQRFLATFYFSNSNPLNNKMWANRVIDWVDRDVPLEDAFECSRIRADLRKQGIDLDQSLSTECIAVLQQAQGAPVDGLLPVKSLARDPLLIQDFVASLKASPKLNFYLYSGQKDPYVPVENFAPELAATKGLVNLHYTNFLGTGHDGYYTEPRVWQEMESETAR